MANRKNKKPGGSGSGGGGGGKKSPQSKHSGRVEIGGKYYIPGTESLGISIGYRTAQGSYITNLGGNKVRFASNQERADYEFEARMQAQLQRRQEEAAANARKAYLELAGSIAVVREAIFVLGRTFQPLIEQTRAFKDAQRQLAESVRFSGASFKELEKVQKASMSSLQLNAKSAAEVTAVMSQLSAQAGNVGNTFKNITGLFDLAAARGVTVKEAIAGLKQALSGSLEGTPLADKFFMKDLRSILADYAALIGKERGKRMSIFDLTQEEKAIAIMKEFEKQARQSEGAYSRFLQTASGQQQIFNERVEELAAAIGDKLDKSFSGLQRVISSVISVFMDLDRASGGAASTIAAMVTVFGTVRLSIMGLIGTLTAVTHSLKSLNIEVGNTAAVISFLQKRALLISGALTAIATAIAVFSQEMEQSTITIKDALEPLDEYARRVNAMRNSLDRETEAINANTTALQKNRAERENKMKVGVEATRNIYTDVEHTISRVKEAKKPEKVAELVEELLESLSSGGFLSLVTGTSKLMYQSLTDSDIMDMNYTTDEINYIASQDLLTEMKRYIEDPLLKSHLREDSKFLFSYLGRLRKMTELSEDELTEELKRVVLPALVAVKSYSSGNNKMFLERLKSLANPESKPDELKDLDRTIVKGGNVLYNEKLVDSVKGGVQLEGYKSGNYQISLQEFMKQSLPKGANVVDADTYYINELPSRLVGIDAFEIKPETGQLDVEKNKAIEQATRIFAYNYNKEPSPGTFEYAAKVLATNLGYNSPLELKSELKRSKPNLTDEELNIEAANILAREQMKIVKEMLGKYKIESIQTFKGDAYNRALINPQIRVGYELVPLAGPLLQTGAFAYMPSQPSNSGQLSPEEKASQKLLQEFTASLKSYLPDKSRRGAGYGSSRRVARKFTPEDFEVELLRLESQGERFSRDNVPEPLRSIIQDMNYETGFTSSMNRLRARAEKRITAREEELAGMRKQYEQNPRDKVLREEIDSAEEALLASKKAFEELTNLIDSQKKYVEQMTALKIGTTVEQMVRKGDLTVEEARLMMSRGLGQRLSLEFRSATMEDNDDLARAFDYMMSLPEDDRNRLMPAFKAYTTNVRRNRLSRQSQTVLSVFQGANIMGAGDMATRGLASLGMLSQGFAQASQNFVSGSISALAGSREKDSSAVYELKEIEYRKKREALLQEDFETEKERRLRLQVLEEERQKYLESQVDTFGSRMRDVFSETADFAGEVFNQVLTQLLVSSLMQGAGKELLKFGLSFIPGGSTIASFLGFSSGGMMSGSAAVVGENPDGTFNRTTEIVSTKGVAKVFNNAQTNRVMSFISRSAQVAQNGNEVRQDGQVVGLLQQLLRETKRSMVMTERGGEVLARRSEDYIAYRERFIQKY